MASIRRIPLTARLAVGFLVGAIALWSIGWYIAATQASQAIERWRTQAAGDGIRLACVSEDTSGYPFRLRFDCVDPVIEILPGSETYLLSARTLRAVAMVYDTDHIILEIDSPLAVARRESASATVVSAPSGVIRSSLEFADNRIQRMSIILPAFESLVPAGAGTLARMTVGEAALFLRQRERPRSYDLAARGKDLVLEPPPGDMAADTTRVSRFDVVASVDNVPEVGVRDLAELLPRWRDQGGVAEVQKLEFETPLLAGKASGTLSIGADGHLEGALNGSFTKVDQLIGALKQRGMISGREADLSLGVVGIFGSSKAQPGEVAVPTRLREGKIYLGPVPVASLPPLI